MNTNQKFETLSFVLINLLFEGSSWHRAGKIFLLLIGRLLKCRWPLMKILNTHSLRQETCIVMSSLGWLESVTLLASCTLCRNKKHIKRLISVVHLIDATSPPPPPFAIFYFHPFLRTHHWCHHFWIWIRKSSQFFSRIMNLFWALKTKLIPPSLLKTTQIC